MTSAKDAPRGHGKTETAVGISKVPDERLDRLTAMYNPRKRVPATIEFTDIVAPGRTGAAALVDPRPWAVGTIKDAFAKYPGIGTLLPALGYGDQQIADLQATIDRVECDLVLIGTPIDLRRLVTFNKPAQSVRYELEEAGQPDLASVLAPLG